MSLIIIVVACSVNDMSTAHFTCNFQVQTQTVTLTVCVV